MEVSNEIKEDIRKTQSDLKNAIRVHQVGLSLSYFYSKILIAVVYFSKVSVFIIYRFGSHACRKMRTYDLIF